MVVKLNWWPDSFAYFEACWGKACFHVKFKAMPRTNNYKLIAQLFNVTLIQRSAYSKIEKISNHYLIIVCNLREDTFVRTSRLDCVKVSLLVLNQNQVFVVLNTVKPYLHSSFSFIKIFICFIGLTYNI